MDSHFPSLMLYNIAVPQGHKTAKLMHLYYHSPIVDCFQDIIEEKFENCECTCNFFFCFSVKLGFMSGELRETLHLGQEKLSVVQRSKMSV